MTSRVVGAAGHSGAHTAAAENWWYIRVTALFVEESLGFPRSEWLFSSAARKKEWKRGENRKGRCRSLRGKGAASCPEERILQSVLASAELAL